MALLEKLDTAVKDVLVDREKMELCSDSEFETFRM